MQATQANPRTFISLLNTTLEALVRIPFHETTRLIVGMSTSTEVAIARNENPLFTHSTPRPIEMTNISF